MAIGKRIKFFRNKKGMTQKQFGEMLGFLGKTSDVRMAQYEAEARIPKFDLLKEMAGILGPGHRQLCWSYAYLFCIGRYVWTENQRH